MIEIDAAEAKTRFSTLLDRVASGESLVITRDGAPVARLSTFEELNREKGKVAVAALRSFRKRNSVGLSRDDIRAFRDVGRV